MNFVVYKWILINVVNLSWFFFNSNCKSLNYFCRNFEGKSKKEVEIIKLWDNF